MIKRVESLGMKPTVLEGTERTVIAAIDNERARPEGNQSNEGPHSEYQKLVNV